MSEHDPETVDATLAAALSASFPEAVRDPGAPAYGSVYWTLRKNVVESADGYVQALRVGETVYSMCTKVRLRYTSDGGGWRCSMDPAVRGIDAAGATREEAGTKLVFAFHTAFQRAAEENVAVLEPEAPTLEDFGKVVDLEEYTATKTVEIRQAGEVVASEPTRRLVHWMGEDEDDREWVDLDDAPGEFAALRDGDRFRAVTCRLAKGMGLHRILASTRVTGAAQRPALVDVLKGLPTAGERAMRLDSQGGA